eukprot:11484341-Ditylum_brightwellii.AAC.1
MITNTSQSHSMLKKRQSANNYHHIREAVAANIVSMVFCQIKYNLADMGTKALNGMIKQFCSRTRPSLLQLRQLWSVKLSPVRMPVGGPLGKPTTYSTYSLHWTAKLFSLVWIRIFSWLCAKHMTSINDHGEQSSMTNKRGLCNKSFVIVFN